MKAVNGRKVCSKCKRKLSVKEFYRDKYGCDKLRCQCKNCHKRSQENRKYRRYKYRYGITDWDAYELGRSQGRKCAICQKSLGDFFVNKTGKDWNVDHCHNSGKVRGILCKNCNTSLGRFKHDISILQSAIDYLRKNNEE